MNILEEVEAQRWVFLYLPELQYYQDWFTGFYEDAIQRFLLKRRENILKQTFKEIVSEYFFFSWTSPLQLRRAFSFIFLNLEAMFIIILIFPYAELSKTFQDG